ncbi:uncharacterized protein LOC143370029 [Andrena cerasifolii]|uniref:uncharacterized protein LOC143370029 n=1 Tax=Andrena cerasifolii TaxID=2819439 RepID=UPI004037FE5D
MQSKPNHSPSQGAVPEQSEQPGQWVLVPFEATNAGGGAGPSTLSGSGSAYTTQAPGENSTSIADVNAGSSRDDGFGGIAGNTGINFGGSGSSGSGQEGYDASNREFSSNANADAVPTTDASSGSWTDGSDGSSAYRQDSSGGLSSAIFNANSNTSGGLASSSSKSTASSQPAAQYQRMTRIQHPAMLRPAQTPTSNR